MAKLKTAASQQPQSNTAVVITVAPPGTFKQPSETIDLSSESAASAISLKSHVVDLACEEEELPRRTTNPFDDCIGNLEYQHHDQDFFPEGYYPRVAPPSSSSSSFAAAAAGAARGFPEWPDQPHVIASASQKRVSAQPARGFMDELDALEAQPKPQRNFKAPSPKRAAPTPPRDQGPRFVPMYHLPTASPDPFAQLINETPVVVAPPPAAVFPPQQTYASFQPVPPRHPPPQPPPLLYRREKTLREILDEEEALRREERRRIEEEDQALGKALQTADYEAFMDEHMKEQQDLELARLLAEQEKEDYEAQKRRDEETARTIEALQLEEQLNRMEEERLGFETAQRLYQEELEEEARRERERQEEEKRQQAIREAEMERRRQQIWNATPNVREVGKRCPHCLRVIYKDVGCDNVKCVCGRNFNYGVAEVIPFINDAAVNSPRPAPVPMAQPAPNAPTAQHVPFGATIFRRIAMPSAARQTAAAAPPPPASAVPVAARDAQDNPSCGHAAADNGPRPAFLDQFLAAEERSRNQQARQSHGSFECPVCADRQCDMFFPCCGGIACSECTVHWLKDNHMCLRCRQPIRQPPMRIVHN